MIGQLCLLILVASAYPLLLVFFLSEELAGISCCGNPGIDSFGNLLNNDCPHLEADVAVPILIRHAEHLLQLLLLQVLGQGPHDHLELCLGQESLVHFVFLGAETSGYWVRPAEHLWAKKYFYYYKYYYFKRQTFLKHGFCELLLVLIPEPLEGDVAEVREEDESVPGEVVAEVHQLLLHRVQAQALEGRQQVARSDARLPDPRLKLPEYGSIGVLVSFLT